MLRGQMNDRPFRAATTVSPCGHGVMVTLGAAVLVAAFTPVSVPAQGRGESIRPHVQRVEVSHGLVTVNVRDASLSQVLEEIARQTDLTIGGLDSIADRITIQFDQLSLTDALEVLLDERSYALAYALEIRDKSRENVRVPSIRSCRSSLPKHPSILGARPLTAMPGAVRTVPASIYPLSNSEDPWDKEDAVTALAESGQPHVAVPLIRIALTDPDEDLRLAAVEALGNLGGDEAAEVLVMALRDEASLIREVAIETLEAIGGDQAAQSLVIALDDEDAYLRKRTVDALAEIGSPSALQLLEYAWAAADDESVRAAAAEWLRTLSRQVR